MFDRWTSGDLGFASPEILRAAGLAEQLFASPGFVNGGQESITRKPFTNALLELLPRHPFRGDTGPSCMFGTMQFALMNYTGPNTPISSPGVLGRDIGVFVMPPVNAGTEPRMHGGGSFALTASDRPEVRALVSFMASPEWGERWAGTELDQDETFISSNLRFDSTFYGWRRQFPEDAAARVAIHDAYQDALASDNFRFDASDLMPHGFGTWIEGPAPGPFWRAMSDWVNGTKPVEELFADLDVERATYE